MLKLLSHNLNGNAIPHLNKVDDEELTPEGLSPESDLSSAEDKHHLDTIIPPTHSHRTIVLCFDGTGDQFSKDVCILPFSK